jgi:MFS superfamily sulfate permease-like transporter
MALTKPLPNAALGATIVVAAAGLINLRSIWRLRHVRAAEVALALVAFGGVLVFGVVGGVVVAISLSIGVFLYRSARPHDAVLARLQEELEQRGIALGFARLKRRQREIFAETGLTNRVGGDRFFPTVRAAVAAFEAQTAGRVRGGRSAGPWT